MVKPISKRVIGDIRQLHQAKYRTKHQLFIAEGEKLVLELLNSGLSIKLIACLDSFAEKHAKLMANVEVFTADESELSKISLLQTPNKVLAIFKKPAFATPDFNITEGIILVLDGVQDPGNMGTMIRTAEWFGVNAVICSDTCVDVWSPKVIQGSMGSVLRMPVHYGYLPDLINEALQKGIKHVFGADLKGELLEGKSQINHPILLVLGSESAGISDEVSTLLTHKLRITGASGSATESLNVAIACGIFLHTFLKP